jgi:hypothetical protein
VGLAEVGQNGRGQPEDGRGLKGQFEAARRLSAPGSHPWQAPGPKMSACSCISRAWTRCFRRHRTPCPALRRRPCSCPPVRLPLRQPRLDALFPQPAHPLPKVWRVEAAPRHVARAKAGAPRREAAVHRLKRRLRRWHPPVRLPGPFSNAIAAAAGSRATALCFVAEQAGPWGGARSGRSWLRCGTGPLRRRRDVERWLPLRLLLEQGDERVAARELGGGAAAGPAAAATTARAAWRRGSGRSGGAAPSRGAEASVSKQAQARRK